MKILTLGSSSSVDSNHMINLVAATEGIGDYEEIVIATLYYSGCSLTQHVKFLTEDANKYTLYLSSTATANQPPHTMPNVTMRDALRYDYWDIIVLQASNGETDKEETFTNGNIEIIKDYVNQHKVSVYDERSHTGLLRHIYVRRGAVSKEILVCLAVNGKALPHMDALLERLEKIPGFTTLVLSVNTKKTNVVLGDEEIVLYGPGYIEDTMCGLSFRLSPKSFYQVNHHQAQRLYEAAISQAEITKTDTVLDLYCGVGTITLTMAKAAGKVIGVEVVPQAVEDAKANALRNSVTNAEFFCGDAGQAALELEKQGVSPDVIVVDPPRKGLNADCIAALTKMSPRRIVYVSCDPATLARDVALLKQRGFTVQNALACDLFPRCAHVESIVVLTQE